jgi:hypothetical protein
VFSTLRNLQVHDALSQYSILYSRPVQPFIRSRKLRQKFDVLAGNINFNTQNEN